MTKYENLKRLIKSRKENAEKYAKESFRSWVHCEDKEKSNTLFTDWIRYDTTAKILDHILKEEEEG